MSIDNRLIARRAGRAGKISYFVDEARATDFADLADEYNSLLATAPRRQKSYLQQARTSRATESTSRLEERLAARLVTRGNSLLLADHTDIKPIDFQVPLKAIQADKDVGKVDFIGISDRLVIGELKIARPRGGGDTPLHALLEALSYTAIVEANREQFVNDCRLWDFLPLHHRPGLLVLGDAAYWRYWDHTPATRGWRRALTDFIAGLEQSIGLRTWVAALPDEWESLPPGPVQLTNPLE